MCCAYAYTLPNFTTFVAISSHLCMCFCIFKSIFAIFCICACADCGKNSHAGFFFQLMVIFGDVFLYISLILTSLAAYTSFYPSNFFLVSFSFLYFLPYPVFHTLFHFSSFLFCYAIFFYPTCFLFQFFPVHLVVRVCHCLLYLPICPL